MIGQLENARVKEEKMIGQLGKGGGKEEEKNEIYKDRGLSTDTVVEAWGEDWRKKENAQVRSG